MERFLPNSASMEMTWEVIENLGIAYNYFYENELLPSATRGEIKKKRLKIKVTARDACAKTTVISQTVAKFKSDPRIISAEYRNQVEYEINYFEFGSQRDLCRAWGWDIGQEKRLTIEQYAIIGDFMRDVEVLTGTYFQTPSLDVHELGLEMGWRNRNGTKEGASRGSWEVAAHNAQNDPDSYLLMLRAPKSFRDRVMYKRQILNWIGRLRLWFLLPLLKIDDDSFDKQEILNALSRDGAFANQEHQDAHLKLAMVSWLVSQNRLREAVDRPGKHNLVDDPHYEAGYYASWRAELFGVKRFDREFGPIRDAAYHYMNIHSFILEVNPLDQVIHIYRQRLIQADVVRRLIDPPSYLKDNQNFVRDLQTLRRGPSIFIP